MHFRRKFVFTYPELEKSLLRPELLNFVFEKSHGKTEKSPYEERHASPVKKTKLSSSFNKENNKYIRRRNSLPDLEVPNKHPTSPDKFKKPTKNKTR